MVMLKTLALVMHVACLSIDSKYGRDVIEKNGMVLGINRSTHGRMNSIKVATEAAAKPKTVFGSFWQAIFWRVSMSNFVKIRVGD